MRARGSRRSCAAWWTRGLRLLLPLVLLLGVLGQGHVLEQLGVACPCETADERAVTPALHGAPDASNDTHGRCPPDCPRCPCGHIPATPLAYVPMIEAVLDFVELPSWPSTHVVSHSDVRRLDRPPRGV